MKKGKRDSSYARAALIVAVAALVVALAGGAYAAVKIKNGSITGKKLAKNAVTTKKIKNFNVTGNKLAVTRTATKRLPVAAGPASAVDTVSCEENELVIGGGAAYVVTNANKDIMIRSSFKEGNGWRVAVHNPSGGAQNYDIYAYCLPK